MSMLYLRETAFYISRMISVYAYHMQTFSSTLKFHYMIHRMIQKK